MYPEHEKLKKVQTESQTIGEFIDWLRSDKELELGKWQTSSHDDGDTFQPVHVSTEKLLAEFFEIDLEKLEAEKRAMLEALRT